jgi:hypothetical protein
MNEQDQERKQKQLVEEETDAAAAEAGEIGGEVPSDTDDPSQQPLIEGGQGEAEGFELAEKRLEEIASHGDEHRFPDRDATPAEDSGGGDFGEADESSHPDA